MSCRKWERSVESFKPNLDQKTNANAVWFQTDSEHTRDGWIKEDDMPDYCSYSTAPAPNGCFEQADLEKTNISVRLSTAVCRYADALCPEAKTIDEYINDILLSYLVAKYGTI